MKPSYITLFLSFAFLVFSGCQRSNEYYGSYKSVYARNEGPENVNLRKAASVAASLLNSTYGVWKKPDHIQLVNQVYRAKFNLQNRAPVVIEVTKEKFSSYEVNPKTGLPIEYNRSLKTSLKYDAN